VQSLTQPGEKLLFLSGCLNLQVLDEGDERRSICSQGDPSSGCTSHNPLGFMPATLADEQQIFSGWVFAVR